MGRLDTWRGSGTISTLGVSRQSLGMFGDMILQFVPSEETLLKSFLRYHFGIHLAHLTNWALLSGL